MGCRACGTPGGGCQFLGTAATSQVVAEALGLALPHSALAPSGQPIWLDMARRSARALVRLAARGMPLATILTDAALRNAMVRPRGVRRLDEPAAAHPGDRARRRAARGRRSTTGTRINRAVPRLVDALPNGPRGHPTVRVFLAGGVPEVMLHLRDAGPARPRRADRARGEHARRGARLVGATASAARAARARCATRDGVDPDDVIMSPTRRASAGLTSTVDVPARQPRAGGLGHQEHGDRPGGRRRRRRLPQDRPGARLHPRARRDRARSRGRATTPIKPGDVLVLIGRGPMGAGMEEIYQITSALQAPAVRQARRGADRRAVLRRLDRRLHRPRRPGGAGRRADRQACATATSIEIVIDRGDLKGHGRPGRRRARIGRGGARARVARRRIPASRPTPACPTTRASGPPAGRRRRHLGRLRLRRRTHPRGDRSRRRRPLERETATRASSRIRAR